MPTLYRYRVMCRAINSWKKRTRFQPKQNDFYGFVNQSHFSVLIICLFQGGPPSPFDRLNGTRQAMKAVRFLIENIGENIDENGKN